MDEAGGEGKLDMGLLWKMTAVDSPIHPRTMSQGGSPGLLPGGGGPRAGVEGAFRSRLSSCDGRRLMAGLVEADGIGNSSVSGFDPALNKGVDMCERVNKS